MYKNLQNHITTRKVADNINKPSNNSSSTSHGIYSNIDHKRGKKHNADNEEMQTCFYARPITFESNLKYSSLTNNPTNYENEFADLSDVEDIELEDHDSEDPNYENADNAESFYCEIKPSFDSLELINNQIYDLNDNHNNFKSNKNLSSLNIMSSPWMSTFKSIDSSMSGHNLPKPNRVQEADYSTIRKINPRVPPQPKNAINTLPKPLDYNPTSNSLLTSSSTSSSSSTASSTSGSSNSSSTPLSSSSASPTTLTTTYYNTKTKKTSSSSFLLTQNYYTSPFEPPSQQQQQPNQTPITQSNKIN
jgi:hypothetical protein